MSKAPLYRYALVSLVSVLLGIYLGWNWVECVIVLEEEPEEIPELRA